jgi:DNA polymerase elongation subunit (family B)
VRNLLIGISPDYLYLHEKTPKLISELHKPYFLVFCPKDRNIESARKDLIKKWENNKSSDDTFSKIKDIGEVETYHSFWDFGKDIEIFKVFTKKSYFVPDLSESLFFNYGLYTAEHDIPYQQRALVDLAAEGKTWIFDTKGRKKSLNVLVYDIETSEFEKGKENIPIDIIGYSDFKISFESDKDLEKEEFSFNILDCPNDWKSIGINQIVSRNIDEEIDNLLKFCKIVSENDIISGHNIIGFDNFQIYNRLNWILKEKKDQLSDDKRRIIQNFLNKNSRPDKSFYFGIRSEAVQFYPASLDTYLGVRKFYSFLNDFSLKSVAPFLGIEVKNRIILTPSQIKIDDRTLKYNKQDVQEQLGVTLNLIQQSLPLAFTTCMPFDMLLSSGAVNMWDHMSLIRASIQKKIMPPICRVMSISQVLLRYFKDCKSRNEIVRQSKKIKEQLSKDFIRVVKYGFEMPKWMEDPYVIYNENPADPDERLNYHMPGGMTLKPDKEAFSHFIPWWYVVVADVGAMYPTILKAMNIGADTVRIASKSETPDDYIWLKKISKQFLDKRDVYYRKVTEDDSFADKGYILGVKIDKEPGVVNCAMTGIISMIAKIKNELNIVKKSNNRNELERLKMMYQSIKGARNAGSHGIISAPAVSGRQFNLWGAAAITTKGQAILADTLNFLKDRNIRVVYGDTDGIYLGCSNSINNVPNFSKSLGLSIDEGENKWLTEPKVALKSIEECNSKWQKELNYPDFELEPEIHDGMIFVKHKNYLIFDSKDGKIEMITKGNNFKGSDKANIARKILKKIMIEVLKENPTWKDENDARESVKNSIMNKTKEIVTKLDLTQVDIDDLTLVQSVQPAKRYKLNQDGSTSVFGKRSQALEKLIGQRIKSRIKLKFVVTKKPLPGITKPSKSGVKPIDYMYPVDFLKNKNEIDLDWYKKMIENYIQGAFGLSDIALTEQTGLDAWM